MFFDCAFNALRDRCRAAFIGKFDVINLPAFAFKQRSKMSHTRENEYQLLLVVPNVGRFLHTFGQQHDGVFLVGMRKCWQVGAELVAEDWDQGGQGRVPSSVKLSV